ncbi:MAG: hypothetical protein QOJ58_2126, partial [Alphaproteobacteria bacterium]|nr:hypothetical protein [Alphaproteobacteria bacterium]
NQARRFQRQHVQIVCVRRPKIRQPRPSRMCECNHIRGQMTSDINAKGRFGKQDFAYVAADDVYLCPAGERLIYHFTNEEDGKTLRRYWTTACQGCSLKGQCTTGKERRIARWEHETVLEAVQARLDRNPDSVCDARMPPDCRAPLRHDKSWMGRDALPDENAQARQHRNGAAHPRLQHETGNEHYGRWRIDGSDPSIRSAHWATGSACQPQTSAFYTAWPQNGHANRIPRCPVSGAKRKTYAKRRETGKE